jgi:opacity protein-like surface antigen
VGLFSIFIPLVVCANSPKVLDDLPALGEPCRYIGGAYYGLGFGLSIISHDIKYIENGISEGKFKKANNQLDIFLVGGFGSAFYKRYYAGIELEFFKRLNGKTGHKDRVSIISHSIIGGNMYVRIGYLLPEQGMLVYFATGFARVLGRVAFGPENNKNLEKSFGSCYPTVGFGVEYKMNHLWNLRGDFRFSITSKDDFNKSINNDKSTLKFEAKPDRIFLGISITRSI